MTRPKQIVLVGAGHPNLLIAKGAAEFTARGIELTLIDPGKFWYSGMATGMLSGQYIKDDDTIDAQRLIESRGGRFISERVNRVVAEQKLLVLDDGTHVSYDVASINIGSAVDTQKIDGVDEFGWTIKPIANLLRLREVIQAHIAKNRSVKIVVIGGGAAGCEVIANIAALCRDQFENGELMLLNAGYFLLAHHSQSASQKIERVLSKLGVQVWSLLGKVIAIDEHLITFEDGSTITTGDFNIFATGLRGKTLQGLESVLYDSSDGIPVDDTLQFVDDPNVFAAGDCANMINHKLPKVGVFGVRQAKVLKHNLIAKLAQQPLKKYQPQRKYLLILNLGNRRGLAMRGNLHWYGRLSYWLKDWIDQRFMSQFREQ